MWYTLDELLENKIPEGPSPILSRTSSASSASNFRDVHEFDRKMSPVNIPHYSPEIQNNLKLKLIQVIDKLSNCNQGVKNQAINMIEIIFRTPHLVDDVNGVNPSDLLAEICSRKLTRDIFSLLTEQLADNAMLGQCLQGRTIRLLQILSLQEDPSFQELPKGDHGR